MTAAPPRTLSLDVSEAVGEPAQLAGSYFAPDVADPVGPTLVCLPGGTYTRGYFDLEVPGHPGYSFARYAAERGFAVVTLDELGTGASSRPEREIGLADQAAAAAAAVRQLDGLSGQDGPRVGVGHSMGGYVAVFQQAAHRSYAGLAILGTTNRHVPPLPLPPEVLTAAETAEGRAALVGQVVASIPERYATGDRAELRPWFHLDDVPRAVVEADDAATLTVVPRRCGAEASVPGIAVDAAAAVEVPVFLAYGEVDVSPEPHREPAFFRASRDVTVCVLERSGHCHNMAGTRRRLWDRLLGWCATVVEGRQGRRR